MLGVAGLFKQTLRFGLSGTLTLPPAVVTMVLLHEVFDLMVEAAAACGFVASLFVGFAMCRYFVFDASAGSAAQQFTAFAASSIFFRGLEYLAFLLLYRSADVDYIVSVFVVVAVSFIIKFTYYRLAVFRWP